MNLNALTAVSPVDGRYRDKIEELDQYMSEYALIKYRVLVEVEYFIALTEIPLPQLTTFNKSVVPSLRAIYENFQEADAQRIKTIEKTTNHDVKAVEYFLREKFDALKLDQFKEFIHFGLTSQDINNTATPLSLCDAMTKVYYPALEAITKKLAAQVDEWKDITMLARTHGQPASPTRLGKEMQVFAERLVQQIKQLKVVPFSAKFGGATGNLNAHRVAYPQINWILFSDDFVNKKLKLQRSQPTTQIEHYDNLAALFDAMKRINTILIDLCRDMWTYISMEYFKQSIVKGEVGSSAMPHKVNPIDFENAEGNFGIANAIFEHLSAKLPISRLQRDLTDSTVMRNAGVPLAHTLIAFKSLLKGLNKVNVNTAAIQADMQKNYVVIAEAIQTILRRENYPNPYEALKQLTRTDRPADRKVFDDFIDSLNVSDSVKKELKAITPENYTGF